MSLDLKKIHETRNDLLKEIKHNDLMSKKDKKTCRALSYFESFLLFISAVSGYVSSYPYASLAEILIGITSSAVELKIFVLSAGIKKYNSVNKKKRKIMIK